MLIKVDFFNIYGVYALGQEVPKLVYAFLMCKPVLLEVHTSYEISYVFLMKDLTP